MSTLICRFCTHANPAGAKFCNDCGSPLHLKPCPHCAAITDLSAEHCHQCGAALVAPGIADASAEAIAGAAADETTGDAGDIRPHVPESLAACLDAGDGAIRPARDEVVHYVGPIEAVGDDASLHGSATAPVPARDRVVSSRRGVFYRACLVIAPVVLGAGAYYAYVQGAPAMRSLARLIVVTTGAENAAPPSAAAPAVPATAAPSPAGAKEAERDAKPVAETPQAPGAAAAIDPVAPSLPGERTAGAIVQQSPKVEPIPVTEPTSAKPRPAAAKTVPARKPADAASLATQRRVARDIENPSTSRDSPSPARTDRDAVETRRLITRELGEFLPSSPNPRSDDSSSPTH
jgi:hypothetical protein